MDENPTPTARPHPIGLADQAPAGERTPVRARHGRDLMCAWFATNLAAVAGVAAAFWGVAPTALLGGWAAFVLLNTLFHAGSRGAMLRQLIGDRRLFDIGIAAVLGFAWGGATALLMPLADGAQAAALGAATFAVAMVAIPVFGDTQAAYRYLLATITVLALGGVVHDGRFLAASIGIVVGAATLFVVASAYFSALDNLRAIVHRFLGVAERRDAGRPTERYPDEVLAGLAERGIMTLADAVATYDRSGRVLRALGDALVSTDAGGRIEYANPVAEVLLGRRQSELVGMDIGDCMRIVVPPDQRNQARDIFEQSRLTRRAQASGDHAQLVRRDGVVYAIDYVATPIKDDRGGFTGTSLVLRDVTEKRHRAETVAWQASHDALTGTINRGEFEVRLKKLLRRAQNDSGNVHTLLYIDIDKFKFVNDTYGHAAGDATLKAMADVLRTSIRGADTLARVGGDEFTALLYSCTNDRASVIAEELRAAVEKHEFKWQSIKLPVSISIGLVEINQSCRSTAEAIRAADAACYAAKRAGRNRVRTFERDHGAMQARVFDFVKDIQTAIHGNRLELFYQPLCPTIMAQPSRHCELSVGVRNVQGEAVPRAELTEMARRYHLTEDIDRWVLKAAIDALRSDHPALSDMELVLVPLSQQSLADLHLLDEVIQTVQDNPAQAGRLGFILDQPGASEQFESLRHFVSALKQMGCRFMQSDAGFGSEAIAQLKMLQIDYLGIRASLVQNLLHSTVDYEAVLALSRIAQALDMKTVAENADTRSIREALAKMGIDYAKGLINDGPRRIAINSEAQWI